MYLLGGDNISSILDNSTSPEQTNPKWPTPTVTVDVILLATLSLVGGPLNIYCFFRLRRKSWFGRCLKVNSRAQSAQSWSVAKFSTLQKHLNVADLLITIFFCQSELWRHVFRNEWFGNQFLCKTTKTMNTFSFYASALIICVIAIDRAFAVTKPFGKLCSRTVSGMLFCCWFLASLFSIPQYFLWTTAVIRGRQQCTSVRYLRLLALLSSSSSSLNASSNATNAKLRMQNITTNFEQSYDIFNFVSIFWLPLTLILVCYAHVMRITVLSSMRLAPSGTASSAGTGGASTPVPARPTMRPATRKLFRRGSILVATFVLCWLPYNFMTLWGVLHENTYHRYVGHTQFLYYLIILNSLLNPFTYRLLMPTCSRRRRTSLELLSEASIRTARVDTFIATNGDYAIVNKRLAKLQNHLRRQSTSTLLTFGSKNTLSELPVQDVTSTTATSSTTKCVVSALLISKAL